MIIKKPKMFKCRVCGKVTTGRLPRNGKEVGDTTFYYPRRHKGTDGKPCDGNIEEAIWVDENGGELPDWEDL